jgi:hypothetical protein
MKAALGAVLAGLLLAGCGTHGGMTAAGLNAAPTPERPGTRIVYRNPDPEKWRPLRAARQMAPAAAGRPAQVQKMMTLWACKPLACAGETVVGTESSPSPTRNPDRSALEKIAKLIPAEAKARDIMMEAASDGDERLTTLGTKIAEMRGYPAILTETKRTSRGKPRYLYRGDLFVGMFIVKVTAVSVDRAEAKRSFEAFVTALQIDDVAPGAAPPPEAEPVAYESPPAEPAPNS